MNGYETYTIEPKQIKLGLEREREEMKVPGESGRETSSVEVVAEKRESMHLQEVVED